MTCGNCKASIPDDKDETCWYCGGPLCVDCWERVAHCGHPEAEAMNEAGRKVRQL